LIALALMAFIHEVFQSGGEELLYDLEVRCPSHLSPQLKALDFSFGMRELSHHFLELFLSMDMLRFKVLIKLL
jgi:hypothetical protein